MSKRARILSFGCAGLLVAAGVAGAIAFSGTFGQVLALVLIGLGFVLATALVFLEVGLSEDRERARATPQPPTADDRAQPAEGRLPHDRLDRTRLGRMRGSRRRLSD